MSVRVNAESFDEEVLKSDVLVLADFYSDSCIPCKRLSPVLAELEEDFDSSLKIVKININFDSELAERYDVQSVPTLVLFDNGTEVERIKGLSRKDDIKEVIEPLI